MKEGFNLLGEKAQAKPCKAMEGLIAAGEETIQKGREKDELAADLALITAAQKVEHYEISGYGTLRELARQIGEFDIYDLLSQTLGEEESADLLTQVANPSFSRQRPKYSRSGPAKRKPQAYSRGASMPAIFSSCAVQTCTIELGWRTRVRKTQRPAIQAGFALYWVRPSSARRLLPNGCSAVAALPSTSRRWPECLLQP